MLQKELSYIKSEKKWKTRIDFDESLKFWWFCFNSLEKFHDLFVQQIVPKQDDEYKDELRRNKMNKIDWVDSKSRIFETL